jgi:hypothetical protein
MRDLRERLGDISEGIAAMDRYRDRDRSAFEPDEMLQAWFLRRLQVISEAARRLPEEIRNRASHIPWHAEHPHAWLFCNRPRCCLETRCSGMFLCPSLQRKGGSRNQRGKAVVGECWAFRYAAA